MIRKHEERISKKSCIQGGNGEAFMQNILNGADELYGKGRLFAHTIVEPGVSFGNHFHNGDNEIYYILKGTGLYNDNGTEVQVYPGDTLICNDGEQHGIVNNSNEPLELIALILYT